MLTQTTIDLASSFGSAAAGALLGSLSAFYLGFIQQKAERRRQQHAGLIRAQYALMSQWNILEGIRRNFLEPHRDIEARFIQMPVFYSFGRHASVPFDDISFIALSDEPNLIQEIHIAEQAYESCIEALRLKNTRTEEFYKSPDVKTIDFDFASGKSRVNAPPQVVFLLKQITDNMYELVDRAIPKILGTTQVIEAFASCHFKGMKALQLVSK